MSFELLVNWDRIVNGCGKLASYCQSDAILDASLDSDRVDIAGCFNYRRFP
jgi:hypothetical protein